VYIEPAKNPGAYDREVFLVLKEFEPTFSRGGDMAMDMLVGAPIEELKQIGAKAGEQFTGPKGYEVDYDLFSINGKMLGRGEPIRVRHGERVLFHESRLYIANWRGAGGTCTRSHRIDDALQRPVSRPAAAAQGRPAGPR
jgi:hypothetical protein